MFFALVQRLRSGRTIAIRASKENEILRALHGDMIDAWMFRERSEEKLPAEFLYAIGGGGVMVRGIGIHEVPHEVVEQLSPNIILEMPS